MLKWSTLQYKFTIGVGCLGVAALMSELWKPILPVWVVMMIGLVPVSLFVLIDHEDVPAKYVRVAQLLASLWYIATVAVLLIGLCLAPELPRGTPFFIVLCSVGTIPCLLALYKIIADQ